MKNKLLLSLSIIALVAISASASVLEELPDSSIWQGYTYYSGEENLSVRIDYAVYDRNSGEFAGYTAPGDGQYIYAYQIFTSTATGFSAVASLSIPGLNLENITGIGTVDDTSGGALDAENDGSALLWEFMSVDLAGGGHSFFLVYSSDSGPVDGTYELTAKDGIPVPGDDGDPVPEPATIALLGLGIAPAILKRKKEKK